MINPLSEFEIEVKRQSYLAQANLHKQQRDTIDRYAFYLTDIGLIRKTTYESQTQETLYVYWRNKIKQLTGDLK